MLELVPRLQVKSRKLEDAEFDLHRLFCDLQSDLFKLSKNKILFSSPNKCEVKVIVSEAGTGERGILNQNITAEISSFRYVKGSR